VCGHVCRHVCRPMCRPVCKPVCRHVCRPVDVRLDRSENNTVATSRFCHHRQIL